VARIRSKERPSHAVRALESALRARYHKLCEHGGFWADWRRLQFDAVQAVVEAQRRLVALQTEILLVLRADRELYRRMQLESQELADGCESIRILIRQIDGTIRAAESEK
jgi:hypothetical protein